MSRVIQYLTSCVRGKEVTQERLLHEIKALTALVDRLSLRVGWEDGPERELKTVSDNPLCPVI